jgi:hypothetical protein
MKMLKKALIPTVLALSVLAPLSAFAADAGNAGGAGSSAEQSVQGKWERLKEHTADQRQNQRQDRRESFRQRLARSVGPHRVMYMELLAEKYAPSELEAWQAAFADRKQVLEELRQQSQGQGRAGSGGQTASQADREARRALYEQFTKAVADQNADEISTVLPKLLAQYDHDTDVLRQRVQPQPLPQGGQAAQAQS